MADSEPQGPHDEGARPPILGSWNRLYVVVLGALALVITLFAAVTRHYK